MRFAREGRPFTAASALLAVAALLAAARLGGGWWAAAILFGVLAARVAYFFRAPERTGDRGEHHAVAPAERRQRRAPQDLVRLLHAQGRGRGRLAPDEQHAGQ
ncbi:MAG TPA: hypothetical protein VF586_05160 [Pyrinomonadaceae bacterium]